MLRALQFLSRSCLSYIKNENQPTSTGNPGPWSQNLVGLYQFVKTNGLKHTCQVRNRDIKSNLCLYTLSLDKCRDGILLSVMEGFTCLFSNLIWTVGKWVFELKLPNLFVLKAEFHITKISRKKWIVPIFRNLKPQKQGHEVPGGEGQLVGALRPALFQAVMKRISNLHLHFLFYCCLL